MLDLELTVAVLKELNKELVISNNKLKKENQDLKKSIDDLEDDILKNKLKFFNNITE